MAMPVLSAAKAELAVGMVELDAKAETLVAMSSVPSAATSSTLLQQSLQFAVRLQLFVLGLHCA